MAVVPIAMAKVKHCDDCGQRVAWTQGKTGKWFLAKVTLPRVGGPKINTHIPHGTVCPGPPQTPQQVQLAAMQAMADDLPADGPLRAKILDTIKLVQAKG